MAYEVELPDLNNEDEERSVLFEDIDDALDHIKHQITGPHSHVILRELN